MKNVKMIVRIILGFISSICLMLLALLFIMKSTLLNKNYILQKLSDNYYINVSAEIKEDMENNMLSSGIDKSVLEGIFGEQDVREDVNNLVHSIYNGSKYEIDTSKIKSSLKFNIDNYLKENNLEASDDKLDEFIHRIVKIYKDEVEIYGYFDNFGGKYNILNNMVNISIVILVFAVSVSLFIIRKLHKKYYGVIFMTSGLCLVYLKYFIWEKIDFKNLIIISDSFSNVLKKVLTDISSDILILAITFIIVGIILNIFSSFKKIKRIKRT